MMFRRSWFDPDSTWPRPEALGEQVPRALVRRLIMRLTADRAPGRRWLPSAARVALAVPAADRHRLLDIIGRRRIGRPERPVHGRGVDAQDFGDRPQRHLARDSDWTTAPRCSRGTVSRRSLSRSSTYSSKVA